MKIIEIYDLESLANLFTYTGYDYKNDKWYQFVIAPWKNQTEELIEHLKDVGLMIGFNNEAYDYPLLHHIIRHKEEYINNPDAASAIYRKSQDLIEMQFSQISNKNKFIPQIDLFLIWHYNNAARHTSLKDLEIQMRMKNVEEMPIHHSTLCTEDDEKLVLGYNKNDVLATFLFFQTTLGKTDYSIYKGKNKIELRLQLNKKFHINVLNMGDVPMGEELMLQLYCREIGANPYLLKKAGGTFRPNGIKLSECIPYWCNLHSPEFLHLLDEIKKTTIHGEKGEFSFSVKYHGYKIDFGQGGAHGCCSPQVWETKNGWIILDLDVSSLYPSVAKSLGLYPAHLGPEFMRMYEQFIDKRIAEKHKPKEERDNVLIEGYKLVLNGVYGKSNESKSFLYDPLYTFKTTIAGQLFICMWTERMYEAVPELQFIQTNTDGITIYIPENKLEIIREVCNQLTKETSLVIEETFYSKMFVRDVNNYAAIYSDNTVEKEHLKLKGAYEIDKEYHKDPSMRIVPYAVKQFFVYNIPIRETILKHTDIFDFCLRLKTNSSSTPVFSFIENGVLVKKKLDRTTRYYISNGGGILTKIFDKNRESGVNIGYTVTLFNKYEEKDIKDYDINYEFYIREANKLKDAIVTNQLSLF